MLFYDGKKAISDGFALLRMLFYENTEATLYLCSIMRSLPLSSPNLQHIFLLPTLSEARFQTRIIYSLLFMLQAPCSSELGPRPRQSNITSPQAIEKPVAVGTFFLWLRLLHFLIRTKAKINDAYPWQPTPLCLQSLPSTAVGTRNPPAVGGRLYLGIGTMSGGIRTSVKGFLNAKRLALSSEIDTVHETNENITRNFAALQAAADSVDKMKAQEKSMFSICDVPSTPRTQSDILLRRFFYNELKTATWNFHPENKLGEGSFGQVFKGWVDDNTSTAAKPGTSMLVAVKNINQEGLQGHEEWLTEIYYLGRLHHPNVVKLLGYCFEDDHRLLVYEFMAYGSLEVHLFGWVSYLQPLSWILRMKIALGAAKSLAFIHSNEGKVIHRDFKSSNILLDSNCNAKLSDFGFAKDGPAGDSSHVSTRVMGTYGYAAPEYVATGHLTSKNDVYGFGVVMLELLSGRKVLDISRPTREQDLVEWAKPYLASKRRVLKIFDARIKGQYSVAAARKAANLASRCLSVEPRLRPNMNEVVTALEQLQESGNIEGSGISLNELRQSLYSNSNSAKSSWKSWISFRSSVSCGYIR